MADHSVKLSRVPSLSVGKADVRFDVADEKGKVGTLLIILLEIFRARWSAVEPGLLNGIDVAARQPTDLLL